MPGQCLGTREEGRGAGGGAHRDKGLEAGAKGKLGVEEGGTQREEKQGDTLPALPLSPEQGPREGQAGPGQISRAVDGVQQRQRDGRRDPQR